MKSEESTVNLMATLYVCATYIACYIVRSKNPLFAELHSGRQSRLVSPLVIVTAVFLLWYRGLTYFGTAVSALFAFPSAFTGSSNISGKH